MRVVLGCGNFGGIGSAPAFFGQGETPRAGVRADGRRLGARPALVRHGRRLRRRAQRAVDRRLDARDRQPAADHLEDVQRDGGRRRLRARARARAAPGGDEPRAARRRPDRPLPDARARPGHAGRGDATRRSRRSLERGTIGAWGVSNVGAADLREWLELGTPSLVQNSYSLLDRGDEAEVIPLCAEHGIAYQAFSPLAGGWLTGKYRRGEERAGRLADDHAAGAVPPPRERTRLRRARGARARGRGARRQHGGLALAWALGGDVVGRRRPAAAGAPRARARGARRSRSRRPSATK